MTPLLFEQQSRLQTSLFGCCLAEVFLHTAPTQRSHRRAPGMQWGAGGWSSRQGSTKKLCLTPSLTLEDLSFTSPPQGLQHSPDV